MAHDHAPSRSFGHSHGHAGHSHAPDSFGCGVCDRRRAQYRVRRRGADLRLCRQLAGADLGRRSQSLRRDRAAAGMGRGVAGAEAADRSGTPTAIAAPRSWRRCSMPGCCWSRSAASSVEAINRLHAACAGRGLDRRRGRGARHRHQWRHGAAVHARPSRRPQHSRRLSAHGGGCRRLARRGGRGAA